MDPIKNDEHIDFPLTKTCAILVGAGWGSRMQSASGSQTSAGGKIFLPLLGRPLISWTMEPFETCSLIDEVVLVLNQAEIERGISLRKEEGWKKLSRIVAGGLRRQDSVKAGLEALGECRWVVVHDGARPCVTSLLIEEGIRRAAATGSAIAGVPVKDTVKIADASGVVKETLPRHGLWDIQTPQVFSMDILRKAHTVDEEVTDDAALVERTGHPVVIFMGSYDNIKVTTPEDLVLAEAILAGRHRGKKG